jgi:hypothetical protein
MEEIEQPPQVQAELRPYQKAGFNWLWFLYSYGLTNGPHKATNFNLKVMHGINKISIVMFLFCLLVMLYRALR